MEGRQALEKGERNKEHDSKIIDIPDEPSSVDRVISVIHGGSEVRKLTKTAAKRHA